MSNNDPKSFHRGVSLLMGENEPPRWDVRSLYPEKSDEEVVENLAEYYNSIS